MFLFSISSGLEFWSVNHTSIYENSELKVLKNVKFFGKSQIIDPMTYLEQIYTRLLNLVDNYYWQYYIGLILLQWFLDEVYFHIFYPLLSYFWCLQVTSSFQVFKVQYNVWFNFKCNFIFNFLYIYSYRRIISQCFRFLIIISKLWVSDTEYDSPGNSNLSFHIVDILNLMFWYEFFIFFHV